MSVPFALVEVIGIVAGRRDSSYLNYFNPRLPKYAGGGESYPGAYGFRLRSHFGVDQLERVCAALERNTQTRQAVLQLWDPKTDIPLVDGSPTSADIPCNISSMLKIRNGRLFWTQIMRSNDLYRGTPYNFVQFTILQEVIAGWLNVDLGPYTHLSDSLHVYDADSKHLESVPAPHIPLSEDDLRLPMPASRKAWATLNDSVDSLIVPNLAERDLEDIAMSSIEIPMRNMLLVISADSARRRGFHDLALELCRRCDNPALSLGFSRWYQRNARRAPVSQ
jgi:thymidylate synthase